MSNGLQNGGSNGDAAGDHPYQSIIEAVRDGVLVIDSEGTITFVNGPIESITGLTREELLGDTFERLVESELIDAEDYDRFITSVDDIADGAIEETTLTFELAADRVVDVRLSKHERADSSEEIVGVVREVTERERRARTAERREAVLTELYEIGGDATLTFEQKVERILAVGCEYLDLPYGFLSKIEGGTQQMVHTVGDHELLQPEKSAPLENSYCRKTIKSDGLVGMQDARSELGEEDSAYELFELGCYIGSKVLLGENTYGTFCFAAPHGRDRQFTSAEREVIKLLGQWTGYELERKQFEERLHGLHRISERLLVAETKEEVAAVTIELASDLFDLPVSAYWEYDEADEALRPLAETDEAVEIVGEAPTFERGEGLVWKSFESGEIRSHEDLKEEGDTYNPETQLRSEIHVPCGSHGVFTSSAPEPRAFDEIDKESVRLLGRLVTEAMNGVNREERLAERGKALQRQNDRLEEFVDVIAHDLRNPLTGAMGGLDTARRTGEERFFDMAERSLERMNNLIDELLAIARGDRQPVDPTRISLQSAVEESWSYTEAPDATLTVDDGLGALVADETRLLQLFGNLFRNSVEHGGKEVTVEVGPLADDAGFYVADDGPGLMADTRTAIQEFDGDGRVTDAGIGLMSVMDIVTQHGWELSVPETENGARFEIRTGNSEE